MPATSRSYSPFFRYGARRFTLFTIPRPFTGSISLNKAFVRLDVLRRKWLLPILVRTNIPDPVRRNRLEVALCVLILYFPAACLRGTFGLLSHKIPRNWLAPRTSTLRLPELNKSCGTEHRAVKYTASVQYIASEQHTVTVKTTAAVKNTA